MSSLTRMLTVLDLFSLQDNRLTAEQIMDRLRLSRTTAYRYLAALTRAGLLVRFSRSYVLGPRAIELDQLIRRSDPLLAAAEPVMVAASGKYGCDVQLLTLSGGRVIVTHHVQSKTGVTVSFGRGTTTPLFQGAGAHVIVASLPISRQRQLFAQHFVSPDDDRQAAWDKLRVRLAATRKAGFDVSLGELDPDSVGVAAPIGGTQLDNPAAIVLVITREGVAAIGEDELVSAAREAATAVRARLDEEDTTAPQ